MHDTQPFADHDREEGEEGHEPTTGVPRHRAQRRRVSRGAYVATGLAVVVGFGVAAVTVGSGGGEESGGTALAAEDAAARANAANRADRAERGPVTGTPTEIPTSLLSPPSPATPSPSVVPSTSPPALARKASPASTKPTPTRTTAKPKPTKAAPAWVSPMPGAPVSSCYGMRNGVLHAGIDLAGDADTPIHAVSAGTVITAGAAYDGYGISVVIDHGNGILTHYAHQNRTAVQVGDRVTAGQVIGYEGATGDATGPHLHFEVHQGGLWNQIDPAPFMRSHGVDLGC